VSGHSKWSTIKRKKGKADAQRAKIFTKLIREIVVTAREGGGDINSNSNLRTAIQNAHDNNMPKSNIDKALKRGTGELPGVTYDVCTFEGYAPGGVAVFVRCLSDNKNRTSAEVRHLFAKYGGHLGEPHSVSYLFESKGVIVIDGSNADEEQIYEIALENGAEDIDSDEGIYEIISSVEAFGLLHQKIVEAKIECQEAGISLIPNNSVKLDRSHALSVLKLVNALEDQDDVQSVSANFDIPDEILNEIDEEF
jgi:YebC/PmpR family DNA-binding regulatory protein